MKKIKIDMSQFELSKDDIRQMKTMDEKTMKDDPNYPKGSKIIQNVPGGF